MTEHPKKNKCVVLKAPHNLVVEEWDYPSFDYTLLNGTKRTCHHGVILKVLASSICGSDMHMFRGRVELTANMVLGHEIFGEVVEVGRDVEFISKGDIVSVPFNVACGRCSNCKSGSTQMCLNVNPDQPGAAYGYAMMGYWPGGQSEYVLIPYADFNLLKIPREGLRKECFYDLLLLSDILPTGYDAALKANVGTGDYCFVAGAGPVGLCCAASCFLLGAGKVVVADFNQERLEQARKMGCEIIHLTKETSIPQELQKLIGREFVDCAIDCAGYDTCGEHGRTRTSREARGEVLNEIVAVANYGGNVSVPGIYSPVDPGAELEEEREGIFSFRYGEAWVKGLSLIGGQCPVMKHNQRLLNAILSGRLQVAKYLNIQLIKLDDAFEAYKSFDRGANKKFVFDPHGSFENLAKTATQ